MRADWITDSEWYYVLLAMQAPNRLAVLVSRATGLRIDDVLAIRTEQILHSNRPTIRDAKTGKAHRVYIPVALHAAMQRQAGQIYVWEGARSANQHRTRQTVWNDCKQAAKVMVRAGHVRRDIHVSPHSARKSAAVDVYHNKGIQAAQKLLQHDDTQIGTTMLYALADQMQNEKTGHRPGKKGR